LYKRKILRNQMVKENSGYFGRSLNTALAIELVTLAIELVTLAIELVTLDLLVARAIAVKALSFSSSPAPGDRSLIRILGNVRERKQKPGGGSPGVPLVVELRPGVEARS